MIISSTISDFSIHQFKIQLLDSEEVLDFNQFKGKKILLVNVDTHQYEELQTLSEQYKEDQNLIYIFLTSRTQNGLNDFTVS